MKTENASLHASRAQILAAGVVIAVLALGCTLMGDNANLPLAPLRGLPSAVSTVVLLGSTLTAFFLVVQFRFDKLAFSGALAGAYAFAAVLAGVQVLADNHALTGTGLPGAGAHAATLVWLFAHCGFPALVTVAAAIGWAGETPRMAPGAQRAATAVSLAAPVLALCLGILALYFGRALLPDATELGPRQLPGNGAATLVITCHLAALAACLGLGRMRRPLDVWITVAVVASIADASLALNTNAAYTVGWYAGRVFSLLPCGVVLALLVGDVLRLHRALDTAQRALASHALNDTLTAIPNRQGFNRQWQIEQSRALRDRLPLSVLLVDIDHFKQINETYGQEQGDRCLVAIADAIAHSVLQRPGDFVARYGGEEFAVLLPNTAADGAGHCAERIRQAVVELTMSEPAAANVVVTVSIGHATFQPLPNGAAALERHAERARLGHLLLLADTAQREAKRGGRNRVIAAAPDDDPRRASGAPNDRSLPAK